MAHAMARSGAGWFSTAAVVMLLCTQGRAGANDFHSVLVIHSFGQNFSPYATVASVFRAEIVRDWERPISFHEVSLEAGQHGPIVDDAPLFGYLRSRFVDRVPDVVVALGPPASRFFLTHRQELFPDTPAILSGDERFFDRSALEPRDVVVAGRFSIERQVETILAILPETRLIAIVFGNSPHERSWVDATKRSLSSATGNVQFTWLNESPLRVLRGQLASLPPRSAVLYTMVNVDAVGAPYEREAFLEQIKEASAAPIFGVFESSLGHGIVGGLLISQRHFGTEIARATRRLLRGEVPSRSPVFEFDQLAFDWRELQRWKIDERQLPPASTVHFHELTLWERHWLLIVVALTVVVLQAGLMVALLVQRASRSRAEQAALSLGGRLISAHEDERRRIARELHDDLSQRLARLSIDAARIEADCGARLADGTVAAVRDEIIHLGEDVHHLSHRLHPSVLDVLGLVEALRAECERFSREGSVAVDFDAGTVDTPLSRDASLSIFRIAQEALRNAYRHARADSVSLSLSMENDGLRLVVSDDGIGFDVDSPPAVPHLGLASMRERVRLLGGKLDIDTAPGRGTRILAWVPVGERMVP